MLTAIATMVLGQAAQQPEMKQVIIKVKYVTFDLPVDWGAFKTIVGTKEKDRGLPARMGCVDSTASEFLSSAAGNGKSAGEGFKVIGAPVFRALDGYSAAASQGMGDGSLTIRVKATASLKNKSVYDLEVAFEPRSFVDVLKATFSFSRKVTVSTTQCLVLGFASDGNDRQVQAITLEVSPQSDGR